MIVPTIGRVVLVYRPGLSDQLEPALVSYVWSATLINVGGFDRNGNPFQMTSLQLDQSNVAEEFFPASGGSRPFACWMPFQLKQAQGY